MVAGSRYHQISKFFLIDDSPNYPDHDFPIPSYKITPGGYLFLETETLQSQKKERRMIQSRSETRQHKTEKQKRSQSLPPSVDIRDENESGEMLNKCITDKLGRIHHKCGKTGPLHIFCRAQMFHSSTSENHANGLHALLSKPEIRQNKCVCIIKGGGGSDWSVKSKHVMISQRRLWWDLNFDYWAVVNLAAGHSAENEIKQCWAPLSEYHTSVTLPETLPGEDKTPSLQSDLLQEEQ